MAALAGLLVFQASAGAAAYAAQPQMVVVRGATVSPIEAGPLWVSKAAWDRAEERLVVADPGSGRIYVYDALGKIHRRVMNPGRGAVEFTKPNYSARVGNRYLIATSMYQWVWFNQDLVAQSAWNLDWEEPAKYSRLATSEFDFSNTHLFAIGAAMNFKGKWSDRAIFSISLADRTPQQVARINNKDDEEVSYYREPPFNLSVCGGKPWLLQMAPTVSIVEARDGGKRLKSFPPEFQKRPRIPLLVNADSVRSRHAGLRNAAVADGLFCADERTLLLLAHRPSARGGLQWLVYPIDPVQDVMMNPIELPTTASEIVFVPGQKKWGILEKGPMKYPGVQPLTRIISFSRPSLTSTKARTAS